MLQIHRTLIGCPIATSPLLVEQTGLSPANVNKALAQLQKAECGIQQPLVR